MLRHPLASLLFVPALALAQAPDFDAAAMARRMGELRPAIEAELGRAFEGEVQVIPTTAKELAAIIAEENVSFLSEIEGGARDEALRKQCEVEGAQLSEFCFGYLDKKLGAMRIVPETFDRMAGIAPEWSGCRTQPFLDVVLIHEAVHVAQHQRSSMTEFVGKPRSVEELRARMAVIEGHAEWVTRRVVERLALQDAYRVFASTISTLPASAKHDPAIRLVLEARVSFTSFQYVEGERFFDGLVKELGDHAAALERAWSQPPRTFRAVSHPDEYLAPPPASTLDLQAVAKESVALLPDGWQSVIVPLPEPTLRAMFAPGGKELTERALAAFQEGVVTAGKSPRGEQLTIAVMLARSEAAAAEIVACEEELGRAKDEQFKGNGAVRITSSESTRPELSLDGKTVAGVLMTKEVQVQGQSLHVRTLIVAHGDLVLEVGTVKMSATEAEEVLEVARRTFELVAKARGR